MEISRQVLGDQEHKRPEPTLLGISWETLQCSKEDSVFSLAPCPIGEHITNVHRGIYNKRSE